MLILQAMQSKQVTTVSGQSFLINAIRKDALPELLLLELLVFKMVSKGLSCSQLLQHQRLHVA